MAYTVSPSVHHALFVLLPVILAARLIIKPRPALLPVAQGVMRFCLGFAKSALLVLPLWHLATLVLAAGPEGLSTGAAWMGLLALMLSLHFAFTGAGDLIAGLGGMLGFQVPDEMQEIFTLRPLTRGRSLRLLPALLVLALLTMLVVTLSPASVGAHLKALFVSPPRTVATVFQEARVWTDYHVVTMLAGLACLIGIPHSKDFLRIPAPWKGVISLSFFAVAVAIQWTRNAPMP